MKTPARRLAGRLGHVRRILSVSRATQMATVLLVPILFAGAPAAADGLPPIPFLYCAPCSQTDPNCGGDDPDPFCLRAIISSLYATPPNGWVLADAGQFNILSVFYPSAHIDPDAPVPSNYPRVVLTFTPGANQPNERVEWDEEIQAYGRFPNHNTQVALLQVHPCTEQDLTCEYEIQARVGTPGDPPDWFAGYLGTNIPGSVWASYGVVIGLTADGNTAPEGGISLLGTDRSILASVSAKDAEGDGIVNYVFDWGDGELTDTPYASASHLYDEAGRYTIKAYFVDKRGAAGSARADTGSVVTVESVGPHVVQVGQPIEVRVQLRNQGLATMVVGHNYGYSGGAPPSGTVAMVSNPGFLTNKVLAPGESISGTYVFDALMTGAFSFAFGGGGRPQSCPQCDKSSVYVAHPITIQDGPAPPVPPNDIFADDFEDGDFDAWTRVATDDGDLSVTNDAAIAGLKGVRAEIDDRHRLVLTDDTPDAEPRYRLGFRLDPGDYLTPGGAITRILILVSNVASPGRRVVLLRMRRQAGVPQLSARVRLDDGSTTTSPWVNLADGPQAIELAWLASTLAGENDGQLTVTLDGTPVIHLPGLDNDETRIDKVRFGVLRVPPSAGGILTFDEFRSRRTDIVEP